MIGIACFTENKSISVIGFALAIISGVFYAYNIIGIDHSSVRGLNPFVFNFYMSIINFFGVLVLGLFMHSFSIMSMKGYLCIRKNKQGGIIMKIQQIRNATLIISYGGLKFLVDPWLQDKNKGFSAQSPDPIKSAMKSPLNDLPFSPEDILKDIDYCLVTHFHKDHFTKDYLPLDIPIIFQNEEDETKAKEIGFINTSYFIENSLQIDGITLRKVPGVHGDNEITSLKMGVVSGYVFQHPDEKTLYIAGDTIYYHGVENNIKAYQPDIIIVNSCDARLTFGRLIMNKEDVVSVCKAAQNAKVIASHMDNVNHGFLTREELKQHLIEEKYDKQVIIPNDGEIIQGSSI